MSVETILQPIIQTGVLGAILAWFMLRLEGIVKENTIALTQMTIAFTKLCDKLNGGQS